MVFVVALPTQVHAGALSNFTEKVKAIFITEADAMNGEESVTPQTMPLFKSVVVDPASLQGEVVENDAEVLSAVTGPLRVSTEDVEYPTNDTISVYEVKKGDTLSTVAKLFKVSKNTIIWANDLKSETISQGDVLVILPITGIRHTVKKNDTVSSIAKKYKADVDDIAKFNGIAVDASLSVGGIVLVPEGEIEVTATTKAKSGKTVTKEKILSNYAYSTPSGFLIRPVLNGRKSQGLHGYNGVDIAAPRGTPVMASADGKVIVAKASGYNGGYGRMVVIAHDGGVQTIYAHLNAVYITQGMTVTQGQVIGEVGNTGRSTGPHLHFEVRGAKNPF